jgi:hypothetical protein
VIILTNASLNSAGATISFSEKGIEIDPLAFHAVPIDSAVKYTGIFVKLGQVCSFIIYGLTVLSYVNFIPGAIKN